MSQHYLKRKLDSVLLQWKQDPERLPLIIKGPRQVGKTATIRHFAEEHYSNIIEINFVEEPRYRSILSDGYSATDIVRNISRIDPSKHFFPGQTLLFFDEIQALPDIATSLKFFKSDGRFDVIASGSLLGIHYRQIESNSVGYKIDLEMNSLDFEEFLWASGYDMSAIDDMLSHMHLLKPFNEAELHAFHAAFLNYCVLGGMPAVVNAFFEKGSFEGSLAMQRQLLLDYQEDIRKYADVMDQARIINVFQAIPAQLAREHKKFQITKVASGARFKDYRGCIEWLSDAGVVNVCRCMQFPELPLKGNTDDNKFKLYFFDTGLLVAMLDDEAQDDLRANRNLGVYKGALYENMTAEAFRKCSLGLYYYKKEDSTLELDFFVRTAKSLLPVEVKASNGNSKSLRSLIQNDRYSDIHDGIKLVHGNIGCSDHIYTFPYFCTFLLKRYLKDSPL